MTPAPTPRSNVPEPPGSATSAPFARRGHRKPRHAAGGARHGVPGGAGRSAYAAIGTGLMAATVAVGGVAAIAQTAAPVRKHHVETAVVTVESSADTYVTSAMPGGSLGSRDQVQASHEPGHVKRAYLSFRIPDLHGVITSAELLLTRTHHHLAAVVEARAVRDDHLTEHVTWRTAPAVGGELAATRTNASTKSVALDVTRAVSSGTHVTIGITTPSTSDFVAFRSREWGVGAPALRLVVRRSVPDPSTSSPAPGQTSSPAPSPLHRAVRSGWFRVHVGGSDFGLAFGFVEHDRFQRLERSFGPRGSVVDHVRPELVIGCADLDGPVHLVSGSVIDAALDHHVQQRAAVHDLRQAGAVLRPVVGDCPEGAHQHTSQHRTAAARG